MSKEIKAGDLVMVSRPSSCCGNHSFIGRPFVAQDVGVALKTFCTYCYIDEDNQTLVYDDEGYGFSYDRLIKIDPPALPESVTTEKEITA